MAKGTPVHHALVDHFGEGILSGEGEISRPSLGRIVFDDPRERLALNQLVHPAVREALQRWISERRRMGEHGAAQIPLLFESGMEKLEWDYIVCVSSLRDVMLERLQLRGMSLEEARKRVDSQMALAQKEERSDRVIRNLGTVEELERVTRQTVSSLLREREI